jgi:putative Ca2+/H+ antiporter (TMEM165/GDT1 family)
VTADVREAVVLDIAVIAPVFALVFVAELPDKSAIAGVVMGARFPWRWIFAGMATAFLTHVVIAVAAGSLLTLLPHRAVETVIAALFLLGAFLLWRESRGAQAVADQVGSAESGGPDGDSAEAGGQRTSVWKVAGVGFMVTFLAEWGDLTQILTANLAAQYGAPLSVGLGAVLALWAVSLLAAFGGRTLLRVLPIAWITRAAAVVMVGLAAYSIVAAIRG